MRKKHKQLGDGHVKLVHQALLNYLSNESINHYPETVLQTVHFIIDNYPNIIFVTSKFSMEKPDKEKDLILYMENGNIININLFLIKRGGKIQPKNPGAKSFFSKYFLSKELQ
ncbi:hypothetical protein V7149_26070, partial [Bacillus sp. JJ1503]|uniref:hypothetical protein n=1 Tax=Bacillus sp. JJ1503 TaxID=3122956 RepID=UPI002FFE7A58